jgi:hypothetical protein
MPTASDQDLEPAGRNQVQRRPESLGNLEGDPGATRECEDERLLEFPRSQDFRQPPTSLRTGIEIHMTLELSLMESGAQLMRKG